MMSRPSDLFLSWRAGNVIVNGVSGGLAGKLYFSVLDGRSVNLHLSEQYKKFPASAGNCLSQLVQKLKKDSSSLSKANETSWEVVGVCLEVFVVWRRERTGREDLEDLEAWWVWPDLRRVWCFGDGGGDIAPTARRGDIFMC